MHSNYQLQWAFAHFGQASVADLIEAISFATKSLQYFDDPIRLQVPYDYVEARIPKPPDCIMSELFGMISVACCFIILVL